MPKRLKEKDPFPDDFWNYDINPILGYKYEYEPRNFIKEKIKYGLENNQVR